jgi:Tfp pilus assembly protein PilF
MESVQIILIVTLGLGVALLLFFIIKSVSTPQKVDAIQKLINQGKVVAAEKLAKQILSKDSDNYLAHFYLGKAYIADKRPELALMEYKLVNANALFGPELPELAFRKEISQLYLKFNQQQDALREFLLLTKLEPNNADNYFNVGRIYEQQNRSDLALGFFQKTVSLNKRHAKAHASIGLILYQMKQYQEAKHEIDFSLSISPETYSSYYYLGKILKENKDYGAAIKAFEKAQRDPEYRQKALIERGTSFMMGNRIDTAIPDLQRAIDFDKEGTKQDTLYARYFLAACYEKSRKIEKAIEQWELIYSKNHSFRDVTAKLTEYKDLQSNDSLKDYLTSNDETFVNLCKHAVQTAFSLSPQNSETKKWGCEMVAVEHKDDDWMNMRKQLFLLRFYRDPDPIEDSAVREALDKMKELNCSKTYLFSSSDFTRIATGYAENRPVELIGKDKLEQILQKTGA